MMLSCTDTVLKQREKIIHDIIKWWRSNDKILNITTIPYSSCEILAEAVFELINRGNKVLYIVNDFDNYGELLSFVQMRKIENYTIINEKVDKTPRGYALTIAKSENAIVMENDYDIVIYDDVSSYSKYSRFEILDILSKFYREDCKIICRSVEEVFQNAPCIEIPVKENGIPINEPRIITTRVDLNKEIPYVIYEYIDWSLRSGKNVFIIVPNEDTGKNVYEYLLNFKGQLFKNIYNHKNSSSTEHLKYFLEKDNCIVITDSIEVMKIKFLNADFIVYYAEDRVFDYKKLVYICGKACSSENLPWGEIVFLSKEVSRDMENCKNIIRGFNKQAWEVGLLNI